MEAIEKKIKLLEEKLLATDDIHILINYEDLCQIIQEIRKDNTHSIEREDVFNENRLFVVAMR